MPSPRADQAPPLTLPRTSAYENYSPRVAERLIITVHVHPGARQGSVGGRHGDALVVKVTARAVDGAANEEVLRRVADAFSRRRHEVEFVTITRSRDKRVAIDGDLAQSRIRWRVLLDSPP